MPDATEQSFSAGTATDSAAARGTTAWRRRSPAAIWRLRPALQQVSVVQTIKTQLIPKIVLALRSMPAVAPVPEAATSAATSPVEVFAALVLGRDDGAPFDHVDALLTRGITVELIYLDLLAPTARYIGEMWEVDATDFANVTLGIARLQRMMWQLGETFAKEPADIAGSGEAILLTIIPGEQHSFGLSMVAEFFRRAGWNLCTGPFSSNKELTSLVHSQWFDIIGFSISSDRRLDELKQEIKDIRRESRNRHVGIILGGPMMLAHPELVETMGADSMSVDATTAPQQAHDLVERLKGSE